MLSDYLQPLAILAVVHLLAAMSPGPSFLLISRSALASGRAAGLAGALGCGLGVMPWAIGAMLGLALIFQQAQGLYSLLKAAGGLYLIYVAIQVWRHAADPLPPADPGTQVGLGSAFRTAFLTQIANPKVAVFFGSIFVAVLPANPPPVLITAILAIVFLNELVWYALVAVGFSAERPRAMYLRSKPIIDRIMAALLGALGVKLLLDARPS